MPSSPPCPHWCTCPQHCQHWGNTARGACKMPRELGGQLGDMPFATVSRKYEICISLGTHAAGLALASGRRSSCISSPCSPTHAPAGRQGRITQNSHCLQGTGCGAALSPGLGAGSLAQLKAGKPLGKDCWVSRRYPGSLGRQHLAARLKVFTNGCLSPAQ